MATQTTRTTSPTSSWSSEAIVVVRRIIIGICSSVLLCSAASGALNRVEASESNIPQCPASYPVDGIHLNKIPSGWAAEVQGRFDLVSAAVIEGPPQRQGELVPFSQKIKGGSLAVYNDLDVDERFEKWLACNYGHYGEIRLYQRLPKGIKRCTMKYKVDPATKLASLDGYSCK